MSTLQTQDAYDRLASAYDTLTADYRHDRWLSKLEALARDHGLRGKRMLDVACGTGKSFLPLLERGYRVVGCDISKEMLEHAARKAPAVRLHQADMRQLDLLAEFDLVTCLDDALNYLLTRDELLATFQGIRHHLAPGGLAVWDLNTLAMYRSMFATDSLTERGGVLLVWHGETSAELEAGGAARATVELFSPTSEGLWRRASSVHHQRHWPADIVRVVAATAGLRVLTVRGQHPGAVIDDALDEFVHTKAVYIACRDDRVDQEEVAAMPIGSV